MVSIGHAFLREDRMSELQEICDARRAAACILKLPPSYWLWENAETRLQRFQLDWQKKQPCPLTIDSGREEPSASVRKDFNWVADPFWVPTRQYSRSKVWRIHGWHEVRWVRRYSESQLLKLATAIRKWKPEFVILVHSQRVPQIEELQALLHHS